jgi:hypothetical protein
VQDQRVGCACPARLRQGRGQLLLDGLGIVRRRDAQAVGDAQHVAIDGQARHAEGVAEHDVGRLAADARQLDERVHRRRHLAVVAFDERARRAGDRSRLAAEEAGRDDQRLDLGRVGRRQRASRRGTSRTAWA